MKKLVLLSVIILFCGSMFSQVYKLEKVYSYYGSFNLSYWKPVENVDSEKAQTFSLWEIKSGEYPTFELEYYKGNAAEMYTFLKGVSEFALKYKKNDDTVGFFSGVQVKTQDYLGRTLIYDKERKYYYSSSPKELEKILEKFTTYCDTNNIKYQ